MSDAISDLCALVKSAGLRVTFDRGRDFTHPCTFCGRSDAPRDLVDIGTYPNGDTLTRPVCEACRPIALARRRAGPLVNRKASAGAAVVAAREALGRAKHDADRLGAQAALARAEDRLERAIAAVAEVDPWWNRGAGETRETR